MTPITGPYTKLEYLNAVNDVGAVSRIFERQRTWYRQRPPYDLPLNFSFYQRRVVGSTAMLRSGSRDMGYVESVSSAPTSTTNDPQLYAEVREKFLDKVRASVELGVAFAEAHQSMKMMSDRLFQIARFGSQVFRGRFGDAAKTLGASLSSKRTRRLERNWYRKGTDSFADNYLEFHFGWSPLLKDIHEAAEALSQPFIPHSVKVGKTTYRKYDLGVPTYYGPGFVTRTTDEITFSQTIRLQASVTTSNPNLALGQQLGMINPATIAWELVPFSFVVDWFVNVGDFLGQFTEFAGIELTMPHMTTFSRWSRYHFDRTSYDPDGFYPYSTSSSVSYRLESIMVNRSVGMFPSVDLYVRSPWALSPRRGLAAASLIVQQLRRRAGTGK